MNKKFIITKNVKKFIYGVVYLNSQEKLNAIKEKYKNGVTMEILEEMFCW